VTSQGFSNEVLPRRFPKDPHLLSLSRDGRAAGQWSWLFTHGRGASWGGEAMLLWCLRLRTGSSSSAPTWSWRCGMPVFLGHGRNGSYGLCYQAGEGPPSVLCPATTAWLAMVSRRAFGPPPLDRRGCLATASDDQHQYEEAIARIWTRRRVELRQGTSYALGSSTFAYFGARIVGGSRLNHGRVGHQDLDGAALTIS
jgi:hypothetical protein